MIRLIISEKLCFQTIQPLEVNWTHQANMLVSVEEVVKLVSSMPSNSLPLTSFQHHFFSPSRFLLQSWNAWSTYHLLRVPFLIVLRQLKCNLV